jgi:hypothetical protein
VITLDGYAPWHRAVAQLKEVGTLPRRYGFAPPKYLNNVVEQDHRRIKQRIRSMLPRASLDSGPVERPPSTLIIPHLFILQDGEGNGTFNRRDKQGLQIRVRVREAVGIAALMHNLGIDVPLAVPERFVGRKLRGIVGAFRSKVTLIDTDAEISEERVRADGRRVPPVVIGPVLR